MRECLFCKTPLEEDNNTDFCNEQCEYDYDQEYNHNSDKDF